MTYQICLSSLQQAALHLVSVVVGLCVLRLGFDKGMGCRDGGIKQEVTV